MVCRVWFEVLSRPAVVISPLINILVCPEDDEDVSESVSSNDPYISFGSPDRWILNMFIIV